MLLPVEFGSHITLIQMAVCRLPYLMGSRRFGWAWYHRSDIEVTCELNRRFIQPTSIESIEITSEITAPNWMAVLIAQYTYPLDQESSVNIWNGTRSTIAWTSPSQPSTGPDALFSILVRAEFEGSLDQLAAVATWLWLAE